MLVEILVYFIHLKKKKRLQPTCCVWLTVFTGFDQVGAKDHQRFQASYATILKAHMTALKKRERKDKKKAAEGDKKQGGAKKKPKRV